MDETEYQLLVSQSGIFNAAGVMSFMMGPGAANERWEVRNTGWSTTSPRIVRLDVFHGYPTGGQLVDTTRLQFNTSDTMHQLRTGEVLTFQCTGGTAGRTGTITLSGSRFVRGRRAY